MTNYKRSTREKAITKKLMFYEDYAEGLDGIINKVEIVRRIRLVFDDILKNEQLKGKTFLDVGCGLGQFSQVAYVRGAKVTGLDVGEKLLKETRKRAPIKTKVGDVLNLPFKDNLFDYVLCTEVIEHTVDPERAIKEILRVCKPGGKVLITTPNRIFLFPITFASSINIRKYQGLENWIYPWHFLKHFKAAGGWVIRAEGFNFLYPNVFLSLEKNVRLLDKFMWNYYVYGRKKGVTKEKAYK